MTQAIPRFGGRVEPGQQIHISVDGKETTVAPTPDGTWTHAVGELQDGDHDFEMWTEDAQGNASDKVEWPNDVSADAGGRHQDRSKPT